MKTHKQTRTQPMTPTKPTPLDEDELNTGSPAVAEPEAERLSCGGIPLLPVTAGSFALLQRTRNGILVGDARNMLLDLAGFVALHQRDENARKKARSAIFRGEWGEFLIDFLDAMPDAVNALTGFAPQACEAVIDFMRTTYRPEVTTNGR